MKNFEFIAGTFLIVPIGGAVLLSPWLFPYGSMATDRTAPYTDAFRILGADTQGRGLVARISFVVANVSAPGAAVIGTIVGLHAGSCRGFLDVFPTRFADMQLAPPSILRAVTVIAFIGAGRDRILVLMIVVQWVQHVRRIRRSALLLLEADHVQAARAHGLRAIRNIFGPILPDACDPLGQTR